MSFVKGNRQVVESRFMIANIVVLGIFGVLMFRLWYLQIYKGDLYQRLSENNRLRQVEIAAPRGVIYDRYGNLVLGNRPFYDLVYIPQYVEDREKTLEILARLLHVQEQSLERRLIQGQGLAKFMPITLKRNLSLHEVSIIESNRVFLPGIDVITKPRRDYYEDAPSHLLGYTSEINGTQLRNYNENLAPGDQPYRPGDLIGKHGLERRWEKYLRGKRGTKVIQVDAFGRKISGESQLAGGWVEDPSEPGASVVLTLDLELQKIVKSAFRGKNGSVVVVDPRNGEILAMLSTPEYDPKMFQSRLSFEKYRSLQANPFKPFLDKTTGGKFVPGSVFKPVVALAALQERVITESTTFHCPGSFVLGEDTFHCHHRAGHGKVNLRRALMKSCDVFFYHVGIELGVDRIAEYAHELGLGRKLGVDLNFELPGLIPSSDWKKKVFGGSWTKGETPNVSIGQGAVELTPVQMATLYAVLGNGGKIWRPRIVNRIVDANGNVLLKQYPELIRQASKISPKNFNIVNRALQAVVMDDEGTGKNARVEGVEVAGKTGSVQVVSLDKNKTEFDVSVMWREHATFAAFSPVKNPEIAVGIISQHDAIGGGGRAAAPVAGKIIAGYWELVRKRKISTANQGFHAETSNQNREESRGSL